jgi:hypothetical protein
MAYGLDFHARVKWEPNAVVVFDVRPPVDGIAAQMTDFSVESRSKPFSIARLEQCMQLLISK